MTGHWYFSARPNASTVTRKQFCTEAGASTMRGKSPWPPYSAWKRSLCSSLVGMPVLGPERCAFTMTIGISAMEDSPISSVIREKPGPEVAVIALAPA